MGNIKQGQKWIPSKDVMQDSPFGSDTVQYCALYLTGKVGKRAHLHIKTFLMWPSAAPHAQNRAALREIPFLQPLALACTVEIVFASGTEPFAACRYPQYQTQLFGQFSESLIQTSIEIVSSQLCLCSLVPWIHPRSNFSFDWRTRLLSAPWQCRTQQHLAWAARCSWLTRIPHDRPCPGGEALSRGSAISSRSQIRDCVPFHTGVWISISCWRAVVACLGCRLLHVFALPPRAASSSLPLHRWMTVGHNSSNFSSPSRDTVAHLLGRWWKGFMSETPWRARPPPECPSSPATMKWLFKPLSRVSSFDIMVFEHSILRAVLPLEPWIPAPCHFIFASTGLIVDESNLQYVPLYSAGTN